MLFPKKILNVVLLIKNNKNIDGVSARLMLMILKEMRTR